MKNFIFISVILFGTLIFLSGCYTYLSLSGGAELAHFESEPTPIVYPPPSPCPCPAPGPVIVIVSPYNPPVNPYKRPESVADLRDGGEGRNSDNDRNRTRR